MDSTSISPVLGRVKDITTKAVDYLEDIMIWLHPPVTSSIHCPPIHAAASNNYKELGSISYHTLHTRIRAVHISYHTTRGGVHISCYTTRGGVHISCHTTRVGVHISCHTTRGGVHISFHTTRRGVH